MEQEEKGEERENERKHKKMSKDVEFPKAALATASGWGPESSFQVDEGAWGPPGSPFSFPKMSSANAHFPVVSQRQCRPPPSRRVLLMQVEECEFKGMPTSRPPALEVSLKS